MSLYGTERHLQGVSLRRGQPAADCFALMEGGKWYGVVRFLPNGKDIVLRDQPTDDPDAIMDDYPQHQRRMQ